MKPFSIYEKKEIQEGKFYLEISKDGNCWISTSYGYINPYGYMSCANPNTHTFGNTASFEFDTLKKLLKNAKKCFNHVKNMESVSTEDSMVLVKSGTFLMGNSRNDSEGYSDEKPVHTVNLTYDYYIGKYEVTFEQYDKFCEDTGKSYPKDEGWGRGKRPVINVSWYDAIEYCNWLSKKEGIAEAYDSKGNLLDENGRKTTDITKVKGYRLPTEAEWEYAARGGHESRSDYKYSGSNRLQDVGWYNENSGKKTQEVGLKKPNELGIYDMSGNVFEWCHDWYGSYGSNTDTNPVGPSYGSIRVVHGGSWSSTPNCCRVSYRYCRDPSYASNSIGFRIVRTK